MLALCATTTGLMVVFSYVQRDMSTALSGKDVPGFYAAVNRYLLVIVIAAPLFAVYQYVQSLVALEWRLWLTRLLLRKYFANHAYFALKAEGTTDNPDQRICDDVRNFVDSCTSVLLAVAQKTLSMGAFFGVLWGISPNLVAFCFLYSLFGTVVTTRVFGAKLMGLHFLALRCEADLRFQLVRAREHAESVALYRGAARELAAARAKLAAAARTLLRKIEWGRTLALFTNAYEFATFALPSLIIAPRFFAGEVEFGVVTQAGYAFRTVQGALNIVVGRFEQLSGLAAETERLERLLAMLDTIEDAANANARERGDERERETRRGNRASTRDGDQHHPRVSYDAACLATARHSAWNASPCARPSLAASCGATLPSNCARATPRSWSGRAGAANPRSFAPSPACGPKARARLSRRPGTTPYSSHRRHTCPSEVSARRFSSRTPPANRKTTPIRPRRRRPRRRRPRLDDVSTTTISSPRSTRAASATSWDVSPTAGVWTRARSGRTSSPPGTTTGGVCSSVPASRVLRVSRRGDVGVGRNVGGGDVRDGAAARADDRQRGTSRDAAQAPHAGVAIRRGGWGRRGDVGGGIRRGSRSRGGGAGVMG